MSTKKRKKKKSNLSGFYKKLLTKKLESILAHILGLIYQAHIACILYSVIQFKKKKKALLYLFVIFKFGLAFKNIAMIKLQTLRLAKPPLSSL